MKSSILLVGLAAVSSLAAPTQHYELHERRDFIPSTWMEGKKLDGKVSLPVRIGLTQSNLDYGHELLMDLYVAHPSSMSAQLTHLDRTHSRAAMDSIFLAKRCTTSLPRPRKAWMMCVPGWSRLVSRKIA